MEKVEAKRVFDEAVSEIIRFKNGGSLYGATDRYLLVITPRNYARLVEAVQVLELKSPQHMLSTQGDATLDNFIKVFLYTVLSAENP